MEYIPITTKLMQPPQDDLFAALDAGLNTVQEKDIIAISSKVVAIHEGRCLPVGSFDKKTVVEKEADIVIPRPYWSSPLTITNYAFIGNSGIDESNADGHYVLLPANPMASAKKIHSYLRERFGLQDVGVVVTDSQSSPLRRGASGVAIGFWGFEPTIDHVGKLDLFDRPMKVEVSNVLDGLAAGATVVMGECAECQPVVLIRNTPKIIFSNEDHGGDIFVTPEEDTFRVLYKKWL